MQPRIHPIWSAFTAAAITATLALAAGCGPGPGEAGGPGEPGTGPEAVREREEPGRGSGQADEAGAAWVGVVDVRVRSGTDTEVRRRDLGSGSARFIEEGGARTRLAVIGNIRAPADAGFVISGTDDGEGWTGREGEVTLTLKPDGRIDGGGVVDGQRLRFDGAVTPERFDLSVDLELLEDAAGGMPAGTRFSFHYDLRRSHPGVGEDADGSRRERDREGDCPRTVWRFRNVPSLSGGSMQMIQVPECVR